MGDLKKFFLSTAMGLIVFVIAPLGFLALKAAGLGALFARQLVLVMLLVVLSSLASAVVSWISLRSLKWALVTLCSALCLVIAASLGASCMMGSKMGRVKSAPILDTVVKDDGDRLKGARDARIKIVEYSDYQCPLCAVAWKIINDAIQKHPDEISLEHHHFPLPAHANAFRAAVFAECAGVQERFWAFQDVLFSHQANWGTMENVDPYFMTLAMRLGINARMLQTCVSSNAFDNKIRADIAVGEAKGVGSPPAFFIGDKRVVGPEDLEKELAALFK